MRIFKTNFLVPKGFDAITIGTWIFIRPESSIFESILEHEKVHVAQFKREPILFWFKYLFSQSHRLAYETEAYAHQIKYFVNKGYLNVEDWIRAYLDLLYKQYRLSYSYDYIKHYLSTYYNNLST